MADTMVFALIGSLIVTLTLLPVLCAWFMRKGVRERRNKPSSNGSSSVTSEGLDYCLGQSLAHRRSPPASLLAISLLLMPVHRRGVHAASGRRRAVGARHHALHDLLSTKRPRSRPRSATSCASFPEVTTVASELGRPDDGTDSTGFFNVEFYVGLKPYSDWTGPYRNKAALIAAINKKLPAFPGIIFNYTQPAEDAVDEAETGLKSALAVKVFGADLNVAAAEGQGRSSRCWSRCAASPMSRWCRSWASPASPSRSTAPRSPAMASMSMTSTI